MQIIAQCPKCSSKWKLKDDTIDKRIRCEKCHTLFKVPQLSDLSAATDIIKKAKGTIYVDQKGKTYG
ncbi:MAG: hypothetical protein FVQ80_05990 [Planctomycetes bacterium]|nr:hypothetical protein [Planctomycetota bacterium]